MPGSLFIVATPIGNLGDISARARAVLGTVDVVACEDTRTTGALLCHLGIEKPLIAYHEHNEIQLAPVLAARVAAGESVALACDAGTPALSDPGFRVVRECRRRALPVVPVPGACALVAALSASGLPTHAFRFVGFLPPKSSARLRFLATIRDAADTVILYESCHRICKFVGEILAELGPERVICIARELTKFHETILTGTAADVVPRIKGDNLRGEFVVLIAPEGFVL
ncbi:MAG: 16S rRNA (cytidine(1402)-2'-O)-methyltransferase [Puniceicoccales bacterium]|jgi:16S rRNA (cytidine1402-2'-O)-methyltransferase|nr:16S rRNA (cytidine(1402)-2'-O)-methyltransferase [Puniceicoccales bacterium]